MLQFEEAVAPLRSAQAIAAGELVAWTILRPQAALALAPELAAVRASDMPEGAARSVWRAVLRVLATGQEPTLVSLQLVLGPDSGSTAWIADHITDVPVAADPRPLIAHLREVTSRIEASDIFAQGRVRVLEEGLGAARQTLLDAQDVLAGIEPLQRFWEGIDMASLTQADEPIPWLVPGYLALGEAAIFAGVWGGGKSIVLADLALAVAAGEPWLQSIAVDQGRVLVVDEEQAERLVKHRLRRQARGRGHDPADLEEMPITWLCQKGINLADPKLRDRFLAYVREHDPKLICFDSLQRIARGVDLNNNDEVAKFFAEAIAPLVVDGQRSVVIIHHVRKDPPGAPKDPAAIKNRIRGAGDIPGAVGAVLALDSDGSNRTLHHVKCRWQAESSPIAVEFVGEAGEPTLEVRSSQAALSDFEAVAINALNEAGLGGLLRRQIEVLIEEAGSGDSVRQTTRTLGSLHAHRRVAKQQSGRAMRYWAKPYAPEGAE